MRTVISLLKKYLGTYWSICILAVLAGLVIPVAIHSIEAFIYLMMDKLLMFMAV